ncbi:MAG: Gfo/Idh/MocA family oxidoreductase [Opitutus sp.]
MNRPRVCLVGVGGYGRVHLQHLLDFHRRGEVLLVAAVVFPPDSDPEILPELKALGCELFRSFEELCGALARLQVDLGVVPTPIHLHARMAIALLQARVHVLVEKPIAASVAETETIARVSRESQRVVAVGFQYLHAPEILALKGRLLAGAIGPLQRLVVHAGWPRSHSYYTRNNWAGRLRIGADSVLDSPVNNAISHFFMVMLFLAGRSTGEAANPIQLTGELYRAQDIESFDTSVLRLTANDGCRLDFYGTHSSREISRPSLTIEGRDGRAEWVQDSHARIEGRAEPWEQSAGPESATREKMLRDVLARVRGENSFVCTPELAAVHVRCVSLLHARVPIVPVPKSYLKHRTAEGESFTFVAGLDHLLAEAARQGSSLAAAGAPWGVPPTIVPFA